MGLAHHLIFFKVVQFLIECLYNYQLLPQDFADSLASHLSVTLTSGLLIITLCRMFFFGVIECLTPPEWPEPWEKATEAACFVDGTYAVPEGYSYGSNRTDGDQWNNKLAIDYYYWTPYILIGAAVILKAPDFFWHYVCDLHPKQPAESLKAFAFLVGHPETAVSSAGGHRDKASEEQLVRLTNCLERRRWTQRLARHLLSRNELVNFDTWHLFALYMGFKLIRLAALAACLVFLKACFGLDSVLFGARMAADAAQGLAWESTGRFPRWGYCDVRTSHLGQWNSRAVQCSLPVNMITEKVVLFLWFWLVLCAALCLCSAVSWTVSMLPSQREGFARTFLTVSRVAGLLGASRQRRKLVGILARTDRSFMLRLVEDRLGLSAAYLAMDCMAEAQLRAEV